MDFWWQGENEMPPVVKSCLNSVAKHAGAHPVRVVSQHNIDEYLTIPQHIKDRLKQNVGDMMQGMSLFTSLIMCVWLWCMNMEEFD